MDIKKLNTDMRTAYHQAGAKGSGIIFAVFDTGVKPVSYLSGKVICGTPNANKDTDGHGTFVAGQLLEWCPDAQILSYRVLLPPNSAGKVEDIISALEDLYRIVTSDKKHQYIVNMSLCDLVSLIGDAQKRYEAAIDRLVEANVPVFVAAGNDGGEILNKYPSCFVSPITVSAVDIDGKRAGFSTWHNEVDFADLGISVKGLSISPGVTTETRRGTSMACPNLAGKAGCVLSAHKNKTGKWMAEPVLYDSLKSMATDLGTAGRDPFYGYGFVVADIKNEEKNIVARRTLRKGMKGEDVKELQGKLISLKYDLGKWGADGDFGSMTESAVKTYQAVSRLAVTGIVDVDTWAALDAETITPVEPVKPNSLLNKFIAYLEEQVKNHSIYVWGGNGEKAPTITEAWIKKKDTSTANANRSIAYWKKQVAAGYGDVLRAFDCSGLISRFLQDNGMVTSKRNCNHLASMCTKIYQRGEGRPLQSGDLVFRWSSDSKYYHVGVYIGNDIVIESKGRDDGVVKRNINASGSTYWNRWGRLKALEQLQPEPNPEPKPDPEPLPTEDKAAYAICTGGSVNLRAGRGTQYGIFGIVRKDDKLLALPGQDGWHEVAAVIDGKMTVGYMSAKYVGGPYE